MEGKFITKTDLKARGWTEKAIEDFLDEPDIVKEHSTYHRMISLYLEKRVISIEKSEEFKTWIEKLKNRREKLKASGLERAKKKREELYSKVDSIKISIPRFKKINNLIEKAIKNYNDFQFERGVEFGYENTNYATINMDKEFLDRITVNYIRHNLTEYDDHIDDLFGKTGKDQAYSLLKDKILIEIEKVYPEFEKECKKQRGV